MQSVRFGSILNIQFAPAANHHLSGAENHPQSKFHVKWNVAKALAEKLNEKGVRAQAFSFINTELDSQQYMQEAAKEVEVGLTSKYGMPDVYVLTHKELDEAHRYINTYGSVPRDPAQVDSIDGLIGNTLKQLKGLHTVISRFLLNPQGPTAKKHTIFIEQTQNREGFRLSPVTPQLPSLQNPSPSRVPGQTALGQYYAADSIEASVKEADLINILSRRSTPDDKAILVKKDR